MLKYVWFLNLVICCIYADNDFGSWETQSAPFRMNKNNLLWAKALRQKLLTPSKLDSLYSELYLLDKEEWQLKNLKSYGAADKSGKDKQDHLRDVYNNILVKYGYQRMSGGNPVNQTVSYEKNKKFHDKNLQRLWDKAERSGLSTSELNRLKAEFIEHEEKVLAAQRNSNKQSTQKFKDSSNDIFEDFQDNEIASINEVSNRKDLKQGFLRLRRLVTNNIDDISDLEQDELLESQHIKYQEQESKELWKSAKDSNFEVEDLKIIAEEIHQYERMLQKMFFIKNKLKLSEELKIEEKIDSNLENSFVTLQQRVSDMYEQLNRKIMLQRRKRKVHEEL